MVTDEGDIHRAVNAHRPSPLPWRFSGRVASLGLAPSLIVAAAFGGAACGADGGRPAAQPAPGVTTFERGQFDSLPLFPRSEPAGPRSDENGVIARSYSVKGASPQQVVEFYQVSLAPSWEMTSPVARLGVGTYRADWVSPGYRLRVSSSYAPSISEEEGPSKEDVVVQYSLVLSLVTEALRRCFATVTDEGHNVG